MRLTRGFSSSRIYKSQRQRSIKNMDNDYWNDYSRCLSLLSGIRVRVLGLLRCLSGSGWDAFVGEVVRDFRLAPFRGFSASLMTLACSNAFHALISSWESSSGLSCFAGTTGLADAIPRIRFAAPGPAALAATWNLCCHSRNSRRSASLRVAEAS